MLVPLLQVWFAAILSLSPCVGRAQVAATNLADPTPKHRVQVRVVDEAGAAIEGARARPLYFNFGNSNINWDEKKHGPLPRQASDRDGLLEFECPKKVGRDQEVNKILWWVTHPGYVTFRGFQTVENGRYTITLKSGFQMAATAIDGSTGKQITSDLYGLTSNGWGNQWNLRKSGTLTSCVFDFKQTRFRLVHLPSDGPAMFSKLQIISPGSGRKRIFRRKIKLDRGTRLAGNLDAVVPRPIRKGSVYAEVVAPPLETPQGPGQPWVWSARVDVKEDGSFVFESLPSGEVAQLVVVCDGWVSSQPDFVRLRRDFRTLVPPSYSDPTGTFRHPQLFELDGTNAIAAAQMERTATCKVTVIDATGKPVPNVLVSMSPNQHFFQHGRNITGQNLDHATMLRAMRQGRDGMEAYQFQFCNFDTKTDNDGVAVIHNLPPSLQEVVIVRRDIEDPNRAEDYVRLHSGETATVIIKIVAQGP